MNQRILGKYYLKLNKDFKRYERKIKSLKGAAKYNALLNMALI